jgi:choline dehydrogenase-like flavoprotein
MREDRPDEDEDGMAKQEGEEGEEDEEEGSADAPSVSAHRDYVLYTRIEQAPNPASRVMLGEENDDLGVPRVRLDWQLTELDKHSIRALHEGIGEEAGRLGLGRVQLREWLRTDEPMWPSFLAAGWHHMGTTRMAENPEDGVVNDNCRVHSVENLYVAGSGPYTTGGSANPTLTLVALSLRLSDHLKDELDT